MALALRAQNIVALNREYRYAECCYAEYHIFLAKSLCFTTDILSNIEFLQGKCGTRHKNTQHKGTLNRVLNMLSVAYAVCLK
jgi:hypothetical protein